ncbi:MAG: hypothetical protein ACQEU4_07580 [Bacillota bacterium]
MRDYEEIRALISYLSVLVDVSKNGVKVYSEIQSTVRKLEKLLAN